MGLRLRISTKWPIVLLLLLILISVSYTQTPGAAAPTAQPPATQSPQAEDIKEALVFESLNTRVTFQNDGSDLREVQAVIKVLSQAGVQGLAVLPFAYTSANESVEFDYVRVRKADGTVVVTPDYNIQDMPAEVSRSAPMYSDVHEKHVTVKALGVGDTLEYLVRYRTTKPQVPGQFWYEYNFRKDVVVKDEELTINVPRDKYVKVASPDLAPTVKEENGRKIYTWKTANLERKDQSKKRAALQTIPPPSVQLTTFRSWEEVGHWYGELARSQVVVTPQIQAKAAELTKGLTTDEDKMRALYDFVSTRYHYVSLSFGIGRYQPHPAEDVFENEYGDCKDKHTLLAALLKAAGYDAWPALINALNMKIDPGLPSVGQFDHVITVVPRQGKDVLWLDTTPGVTPFGWLMPNLRDRQALVIPTDKPARLMTTPENPPLPETSTFNAKGKLDSDGTLTAHIALSAFGDNGVLERFVFQSYPPAQWKDVMQQMSYAWGFAGEVSKIDVKDVNAINQPVDLAYDYKREKYSDWANGRISAPMPPMMDAIADDAKKPEEPIYLGAPGTHNYSAEIELPAGNQKAVPPSDLKLTEDFADYNSTYEIKNGVLVAKRQLIIKKSHIPISDWEKYKTFTKFVISDRDSWIQMSDANDSEAHPDVPSDPEAARTFQEGYEALQRRDMTRAMESFSRVLELEPKYPGAHANLGMTYLSTGSMDAGVRELKKEQELYPDDPFAYQTLARVYVYKHDNAAAIDQLQKLLKIDPKNRDGALNLGQLLATEKRYPEAVAVLQKANQLAPNSGAVKYELGYAYIKNGDKEKGLEVLKSALAADQDTDHGALALNNVAYSLIELDTGMEIASQYAVKSLAQQQAESLKVGTGHYGLAATANLGAVWDTVGWIYFKQGNLDKALPYLRASWLLNQDVEVGDHLGQLYAKQGKKQQAAHTYQLAYAAITPQKAPLPNSPAVTKLRDHYQELMGKAMNPGTIMTIRKPDGTYTETPSEELSRMRMVKISTTAHPVSRGTFSIVFVPGAVEEVAQIDGDESLKELIDKIKAAKFNVEFPDSTPTKLVRRGILSCGGLGCDLVFIPVDDRDLLSAE